MTGNQVLAQLQALTETRGAIRGWWELMATEFAGQSMVGCNALRKIVERSRSDWSGRRYHQIFANGVAIALGCPPPFPGAGSGQGSSSDDQATFDIVVSGMGGTPEAVRIDMEPIPAEVPAPQAYSPLPPPGFDRKTSIQPPGNTGDALNPQEPGDTAFIDFGWAKDFFNWIKGKIPTGSGVCGFAKQLGSMLNESRKKNWTHIALFPSANAFVYSPDNEITWKLPTCRLGSDQLSGDVTLDANQVATLTERQQVQSTRGGVPVPPGSPGIPMPGSTQFFTPVAPNVYQVRRCPPGLVMAINELCYPRKLLPVALRMNKPKKAPVSHSDAKSIVKARRASKRLKRYMKALESDARKLAPRPRRRLPPPKQ